MKDKKKSKVKDKSDEEKLEPTTVFDEALW